MKTLEDGNFVGKRVIVRIDADVPLIRTDETLVSDDYRLRMLLPTLNFLLNRKAQVVLLGHLGRPTGPEDASLSLRPIYIHLSALLKKPIKFSSQLFSESTKKAVDQLEDGELIGLENLRFDKGEAANSRSFARKLASYGEIYVNESFASSHREAASTVAITEFLPSFAGLRFELEHQMLKSMLHHPARPFVAIVGGAKAEDKLPVIKGLLPQVDRILIGGRVANNFLAATGFDVGGSKINDALVKDAVKLLKQAKGKIVLPTDVVEDGGEILDLGKNTIDSYCRYLRSAKTVFWSGPIGLVEKDEFRKGSEKLTRTIIQSPATSIAGGGNTTEMLDMFHARDKFSFVSTAGTASLAMLSGEALPGLKALS